MSATVHLRDALNNNIDGKTMRPRNVKPPCNNTCFYECRQNFTFSDRLKLNATFWSLSDKDKTSFYCKFVKKKLVKRRRVHESTKKKNTYNFYLQLEERIHQVCKTFFLNTIDVSERRIYYFHNHLNDNATGCPITSNKGRNVKKVIPPAKIEGVVNHISSFPTIDSHYCRSSSERKYLDSNLTVAKMYSLYREITNDPVKEAIYRKQFKSFNISFYKPKKDQCDKCIIFKNCQNPNEAQITDHNVHQADKMAMKAERQLDRQNIEPKHAVICIDLQSVFALPKGNASAFFYKRKLNVYNMTATCIVVDKPKITYCAM